MKLETQYANQSPRLEKTAKALLAQLSSFLEPEQSFIDQIKIRVKSASSFLNKARKKNGRVPKYVNPFREITDQIGFRVVVRYRGNVSRVKSRLLSYYREIENQRREPEPSAFGYEAHHIILCIPEAIRRDNKLLAEFFEVQIHTLFQHAWAEAEHDIGYKTIGRLSKDKERRLAWLAASAWGADKLFEELRRSTRK